LGSISGMAGKKLAFPTLLAGSSPSTELDNF